MILKKKINLIFNMPINKKITECPMGKNLIPKDKKCQKCDYYNLQKWYNYSGEVEAFCTYDVLPLVADVLKSGKPKKYKKEKHG